MTTTERPAPALTPCPSWCQEPAGHPWTWETFGDTWRRDHVQGAGDVELRAFEVDDAEGWGATDIDGPGRTFVDFFNFDHFTVDDTAQVALDAAEAVVAAVTDRETCTEDTYAIRRVLAERAVLDAVRAWAYGDASTRTVEDAYVELAAVLAEEVER